MSRKSDRESKLVEQLRRLAIQMPPGARLPSVRELMQEHSVSPVTVRKAIGQLSAAGLIEARAGSGIYVLRGGRRPLEPQATGWQTLAIGPGRGVNTQGLDDFGTVPGQDAIVMNAGYLPLDLQPLKLLQKASTRASLRPDVWARMPIEGAADLRNWFAAESQDIFAPYEVLICPGTQSALSAAFRALAAPGDKVVMESPTYAGAIAAAKAAGLQIIPVAIDADGIRPELLEQALQRSQARLMYCQPCYANPTGTVMGATRRREVIDLLTRHHALLIEDDWARDFHLGPGPIPLPLAYDDPAGHVIYIRSLTKSSVPGLRIGAICARGPAHARLRQARLIDDFFVSGMLQYTLLELVSGPGWQGHMRTLRASLSQRRDALVHEIRAQLGATSLPHVPEGGLHLWVNLPPGTSDRQVSALAAQSGVLTSPGAHWFPAEQDAHYLRLSFASLKPEEAKDGISRIKSAIMVGMRA